jgi:hypothetical protein
MKGVHYSYSVRSLELPFWDCWFDFLIWEMTIDHPSFAVMSEHPNIVVSSPPAPKLMPKAKTKERTYLTEEEKKVLFPLLEEWNSKPDKKSRDAFVSSEALPKIQKLDPSRYGPEIISKDKASKELWERRIQVCH